MGSQELADDSAGVTGRGLLDDEELGKMAVRTYFSSSCAHLSPVFPHTHVVISIRPSLPPPPPRHDGVRGSILYFLDG